MIRTTEAVISEMVEAYGNRHGQWIGLGEIATTAGLTAEDVRYAVEILINEDETFRAEPAAMAAQATDADRAVAPVIGGEARHMIRWA